MIIIICTISCSATSCFCIKKFDVQFRDNHIRMPNIGASTNLHRIIEVFGKLTSEVLEELVDDTDSSLHVLGPIWQSGLIKGKILRELAKYWTQLAMLGRTLEEAAR